jgi:hypothetical protein
MVIFTITYPFTIIIAIIKKGIIIFKALQEV